jgi:ABC-2 type transport system permease protein
MRLRACLAVVENCFKTQLEYRFNFLTGIVTPMMSIAVLWFVWAAVYASSPSPSIGGYTFGAMITYTAIAVVIRSWTWLETENRIEEDVKTGAVVGTLIKPVSYPIFQFVTDTGGMAIWMTSKLPFIIFAVFFLGISGPVSPLFFLSAVLGYLINYFLAFLTALWAFWTTGNIWGLRLSRQMISEIVSGALMPLSLFPLWMQNVFSFLPFQAVFYLPLSIYMGTLSGGAALAAIAVQLGWIGLLFVVTHFAWKATMKHVVVQGG